MSRFLSLPAELRNAIYKLYIRNAFLSRTNEKKDENEQEPISFMTWNSSAAFPLHPDDLALLRANKQVHSEASQILYREIAFISNLGSQPLKYNDVCSEVRGIYVVGRRANSSFKLKDLLIEEQFDMRVDTAALARFRTLEFYISLATKPPSREQHNAICNFLVRLHTDIAVENATNPISMVVRFIFLKPSPAMRLNQKVEPFETFHPIMDTMTQIFTATEKLTVQYRSADLLPRSRKLIKMHL
jgi:hypothetical protein